MTKAGPLACALVAAAGAAVPAAPVHAQPVVQALPPPEAATLNAAMRRLAQRPNDVDALVTAGNASLTLRDNTAAAGFFARAAAIAPDDPRVLLGRARVALAQARPVEALQGFAQAEKAGVTQREMAADRALAYDLVGDNAAAQALYRSALAAGEDTELRRRLALSFAIAGNRAEFEKALYPLLRDKDRSAFRTRAFGLAILGLTDDAVEIADAMMPTDLALRMAPYLRYMPRLTKAQQAAAGNLGAFPAAADIGRDSADIAAYAAAGARIAARADSSLTPGGAPLGKTQSTGQSNGVPSAKAAKASTRRRPDRDKQAKPARVASAAGVRSDGGELPPVSDMQGTPAPLLPAARPSPLAAPARREAVVVATSQPAPQTQPALLPATPAAQPEPERPSIAEAFADLGPAPHSATAPAAGAVDVAKLEAARKLAEAKAAKEAAAKAKAEKEAAARAAKLKAEREAKAAEPARHWLQVGVGRNVSAFAFDWKKLVRQAGDVLDGKGPWAVRYGATNRMLAGPYPTAEAARDALKQLKAKDIDVLPFNSAAGEKVTRAD